MSNEEAADEFIIMQYVMSKQHNILQTETIVFQAAVSFRMTVT